MHDFGLKKIQKMSVIRVTNIDSSVSESYVRRYFRHYGGIAQMTFRPSKDGKHDGKATITYYSEIAGLQACEKNGAIIGGYPVTISLSLGKYGKGSPEQFYRKRLFNIYEILIIILTLIVSVAIRCPNIAEPAYLIGEEPLIFEHMNSYIAHKRPYDDQPPLGKFIYTAWAVIWGYKGKQPFEMKNQTYIPFLNTTKYVPMRRLSNVCGSLVPPIIVAAVSLRFHSITALLLTSILVTFDFGLITISRYMSLDSICLFFASLSIYYTCKLYRRNTFWNGMISVIFAVLATSIRYPAAGLLFFIFFSNWHLGSGFHDSTWNIWSRTIGFIWIGLTFLSIFTFLHLMFTPKPGEGDLHFPENFRDRETAEAVIRIIWKQIMYKSAKTYISLPQSGWTQWPTWRVNPMVIFTQGKSMIAILNSPALLFGCLIGLFWCLILGKYEYCMASVTAWCFLYYYKAATFLFDFYIPLLIAIGSFAMAYDRLPRLFKYPLLIVLPPLAIGGFYFFMPLIYGHPIERHELAKIAFWPTFKRMWNVY